MFKPSVLLSLHIVSRYPRCNFLFTHKKSFWYFSNLLPIFQGITKEDLRYTERLERVTLKWESILPFTTPTPPYHSPFSAYWPRPLLGVYRSFYFQKYTIQLRAFYFYFDIVLNYTLVEVLLLHIGGLYEVYSDDTPCMVAESHTICIDWLPFQGG